jgi:hypothetical protein
MLCWVDVAPPILHVWGAGSHLTESQLLPLRPGHSIGRGWRVLRILGSFVDTTVNRPRQNVERGTVVSCRSWCGFVTAPHHGPTIPSNKEVGAVRLAASARSMDRSHAHRTVHPVLARSQRESVKFSRVLKGDFVPSHHHHHPTISSGRKRRTSSYAKHEYRSSSATRANDSRIASVDAGNDSNDHVTSIGWL